MKTVKEAYRIRLALWEMANKMVREGKKWVSFKMLNECGVRKDLFEKNREWSKLFVRQVDSRSLTPADNEGKTGRLIEMQLAPFMASLEESLGILAKLPPDSLFMPNRRIWSKRGKLQSPHEKGKKEAKNEAGVEFLKAREKAIENSAVNPGEPDFSFQYLQLGITDPAMARLMKALDKAKFRGLTDLNKVQLSLLGHDEEILADEIYSMPAALRAKIYHRGHVLMTRGLGEGLLKAMGRSTEPYASMKFSINFNKFEEIKNKILEDNNGKDTNTGNDTGGTEATKMGEGAAGTGADQPNGAGNSSQTFEAVNEAGSCAEGHGGNERADKAAVEPESGKGVQADTDRRLDNGAQEGNAAVDGSRHITINCGPGVREVRVEFDQSKGFVLQVFA